MCVGRHYIDKPIGAVGDELSVVEDDSGGEAKRRRVEEKEIEPARMHVRTYDPRFLLFEFTWNILLRSSQVAMVRQYVSTIRSGGSMVKQMIMGAGKTTVVCPLLTLMLGDGETLVLQVVPPALLDFSRSVMRSTFSSIMQKRIYTLSFDRSTDVNSKMYHRLMSSASNRGVVMATPMSIKSIMLKFLELLDLTRDASRPRSVLMEQDVQNLGKVLQLFRSSVLIMDEVDLILHPMKSELNFPIGPKEELDLSPLRWHLSIHLLDSIFYAERKRMSVPFKMSSRAQALLENIRHAILNGLKIRAIQRNPHITLLNAEWYHKELKPLLASWLHLWLEAQHLSALSENEIKEFLLADSLSGAVAADISILTPDEARFVNSSSFLASFSSNLTVQQRKMLNLCRDWLHIYMPHVLAKVDRVSFGIMNAGDYDIAIASDPHMPRTRACLAIPFVGKDVPSRSSEFAHPDIIIGLTVLAYRYEGLRWSDFVEIISTLRATQSKEMV